ncbi:MAG: class I adenylate-forming enzyme family protein [Acidiferrobacteraceae bacterium]
MLLHETLAKTAERAPNDEALIVSGQRYRYSQIQLMVDGIAALFRARGVEAGDRVAILLQNGIEAVISYYAALEAGAIFMPINPLTKPEKLAYILRDAEPSVLVTDGRGLATYHGIASVVPRLRLRLVCEYRAEAHEDDLMTTSFSHAIRSPLQVSEKGLGPVARIDQDLAAILYTSGSTGTPKGVMLTHLNMLSASSSITEYLGLESNDNILCALPLSFDYGLYQILMAFRVGARVTLERSLAFPAAVLETMMLEGVTVLPGVPTVFSILCGTEALRNLDHSTLRMATNTGAALSIRQIKEIRRTFPQAKLFSMYGLTECKRVSYLPPEELDRRPDSVGRGMPNQELYLIDEEGRRLPWGATGELVIRGSHVMRGYWRKPEETAVCLRPGPNPGETVLHSGDLFRSDEEGYLYFIGRRDDIIKSGGEKVSPKEVEHVLCALDGVAEAAVVGIPDTLLGQVVKVFVVLRPDYRYHERDLIRYCREHLENHMVPKYVEFVASLPRTPNGKVAKRELNSVSSDTKCHATPPVLELPMTTKNGIQKGVA